MKYEIWNKKYALGVWDMQTGIQSRTTTGTSSNDSWTNQMGRPKPRADISIENQSQILAIQKIQTKAKEEANQLEWR